MAMPTTGKANETVAAPLSGAGVGAGLRVGVVLVGGGGHAVVIAEALRLAGVTIAGFLDDHPAAPLAAVLIDLPQPFPTPVHLGPLAGVAALGERAWIMALGDLKLRRVLLNLARGAEGGARAARASSAVHPRAFVSPTAVIAAGVFVGPGAIVHARAKIGPHATINSGAIVEHDCVIDENAHVGPGAALGGACHVGADTLIGLGARLLPGVRVGTGAVVGAGAVVLEHVRDGAKVVGVPARVV